jgi:hypothetical protein
MVLAIIFAVALSARLLFVRIAPYDSGDWVLYRNVAGNILHGCGVAVTIAEPPGCTPHFGGNQLPLYPALVATIWWIFGESNLAVQIVQSIFATVATCWLSWAVWRVTRSHMAMAAVGLLQAASLIQAYWAGNLLTEMLAIASTQWVLAEVLLSYAAHRLRALPVGVALAIAVWVRLDGILMIVPVGAAAWYLHRRSNGIPTWTGMRACLVVTLMVALPCMAWTVRNKAVGIYPFPRSTVLTDGTYGPTGYYAWAGSWITTQNQREQMSFAARHYERIKVDPAIYRSAAERADVEGLLRRLHEAQGQPFPVDIDTAFGRLAKQREATTTAAEHRHLAVQRAWALTARWIWPWTSNVGDGRGGGSPTDYDRFCVLWGAVAAALYGLYRRDRLIGFVSLITAAFVLVRTLFFLRLIGIEGRYLVEFAPFLETLSGLGIAMLLGRRRPDRPAGLE